MDEQIITPFDLIEIKIGDQIVRARPTEWDKEFEDGDGHAADGTYPVPTKFETACPHCSQMLEFDAGYVAIKCKECENGEDVPMVKEAEEDPFCDPGEYTLSTQPTATEVEMADVMGIIDSLDDSDDQPAGI